MPTSVQKSYFLLKDAERNVLNIALEKYRSGQSEPIVVGDSKVLKPALRLMGLYRLVIQEITETGVTTSYTRWIDSVQLNGEKVYVMFSPRFKRIWLESKCLLEYADQKPAQMELRSQYALRMYGWAKKYVSVETKTISLEQLRKVLGLESVTAADGKVIHEAQLPIWANLRQRAVVPAIAEINKKTDLKIEIESIERAKHRRVTSLTFTIKERAVPGR